MMTPESNNLVELLNTIEKIRLKDFTDIPEELVTQLITLEDRYFDERTEVRNRFEKLVDAYLKKGEA